MLMATFLNTNFRGKVWIILFKIKQMYLMTSAQMEAMQGHVCLHT